MKLFADDAKLYTEIKSNCDVLVLQRCIDDISSWASVWQLSISIPKCALIDIGNKDEHLCENTIEGNLLNCVDTLTDLGVIINNKLTFTPHINKVVAKLNSVSFSFLDLLLLATLWLFLNRINLLFYHLLNTVLLSGLHISWGTFISLSEFNAFSH